MKPTKTLFSSILVCLVTSSVQGAILSNGTGGGAFDDGSTWALGVKPEGNQDWTVVIGDTITAPGGIGTFGNSIITVQGTLDSSGKNVIFGGATLNVEGGTLSFDRLFNNPSVKDSTARVNISAGSVTYSGRFAAQSENAENTAINSFTQSGGSITTTGGFFALSGTDADDRAQFTIIGNAGSFQTNNLTLFNTKVGLENSATDINFNFGLVAGAGALTSVNSTGLTLGGNAFNIDFTNIDRGTNTGAFSTTLLDYSGTLTGTFGTLTSEGLGAGESASLFLDTTNKLIRVDYFLAAVPEPSSLALFAGALGMLSFYRRRN